MQSEERATPPESGALPAIQRAPKRRRPASIGRRERQQTIDRVAFDQQERQVDCEWGETPLLQLMTALVGEDGGVDPACATLDRIGDDLGREVVCLLDRIEHDDPLPPKMLVHLSNRLHRLSVAARAASELASRIRFARRAAKAGAR